MVRRIVIGERKLAMAVTLAVGCLMVAAEAPGQSQRFNRRGFGQQGIGQQPVGGVNSGIIGGQQATQGFGQGAFGAGPQGPIGPQFGQGAQQGGFGQNRQQDAFVGNTADDMRNSFQNLSGRQRRRVMFDMMVENLNEMRDRRRRRDERRRRPDPIRVQIRPRLEASGVDVQQMSVTMQANLTRALELQGVPSTARVELNEQTATLSGTVISDRERAVIEKMISLQPGVSRVENQLTVEAVRETTPPAVESTPAEAATLE